MPQVVTSTKRLANYSSAPLKKRPIKYELEEDSDTDNSRTASSPGLVGSEPENLSTKPQDLSLTSTKRAEAPSPPPISLVAGRIESDFGSHHHAAYTTSAFLSVAPQVLKSGSPLESISFNSPWSRGMFLPNFPIVPYPRSESLSPPVPGSYSRPRSSSGGSAGSLYSSARYSPYSSRDGCSPARMSPPTEVSYPPFGIKHEEGRGPSSASRSRLWSPVDIVSSSHPSPNSTSSPFITSHMLTAIKDEQYRYPSPPHSHGSSSADFSQSVSSRSSSISSGSQSPVISSNSSGATGSVRYQCPDCNKSYSTFSGLSKHLQFHCTSQNKKEFVCKHCEKVYVSLGALKMHIRTHTLPCKCNLCGKAFSRPWLLQGHIRTHTGEKPFTCQHCNRAFADRSNLRAHLQTHSEVKKYSCKTCAKTFSRMSLLVKHEEGGCSSLPC